MTPAAEAATRGQQHGYYRLAAVAPRVRVADVAGNTRELIAAAHEAAEQGAHVILFPELALTGYSCGDLFFQATLQAAALRGLRELAEGTAGISALVVTTIPLLVQEGLYNVAAVLKEGRLLGLAPKSVLPNYREFYERRQFRPAADLRVESVCVPGWGETPIGTDLLFCDGEGLTLGVEVSPDLVEVIDRPETKVEAANG